MLFKNLRKGEETRESAGDDIIEYVLLNDDNDNDNNHMHELWEINYTASHALDVRLRNQIHCKIT